MNTAYRLPLDIRWSDLDPNFHVRHSVYYDWGAYCRISYLNAHDLGSDALLKHQIGPILFREEAVFRKEILMGDTLSIDLLLVKARRDHSRWTIRHRLLKADDTVAAIITVDGAWINSRLRRLATPPPQAAEVFDQMPRAEDFAWL